MFDLFWALLGLSVNPIRELFNDFWIYDLLASQVGLEEI
jgi:hypothetical protein